MRDADLIKEHNGTEQPHSLPLIKATSSLAISFLGRACFHIISGGWGSQEALVSGRGDYSFSRGWELAPAPGYGATTQEALGRNWALPMCESTPGYVPTLACRADGRAEPSQPSPWPPCLRVLKLALLVSAHLLSGTPNAGSHLCTTSTPHRGISPALVALGHSAASSSEG